MKTKSFCKILQTILEKIQLKLCKRCMPYKMHGTVDHVTSFFIFINSKIQRQEEFEKFQNSNNVELHF